MTGTDPYGDTEILCEACKRPLREPASRALGRGPVCRKGLRDLHLPRQDFIPGLNLPTTEH